MISDMSHSQPPGNSRYESEQVFDYFDNNSDSRRAASRKCRKKNNAISSTDSLMNHIYELPTNKNCYSKITIKPDVVLTTRKIGDQWFLTRAGTIVKMVHATKVENSYIIYGFSVMSKKDFFSKATKIKSFEYISIIFQLHQY